MKITRKELRCLIETTIKPSIPGLGDDMLGKIDTFARSPDLQADADSFAGSFGYPEDKSYSQDLATYDAAGRVTIDMPKVPLPNGEEKVIPVAIPGNLVDSLIENYQILYDLEQKGLNILSKSTAKHAINLRNSALKIYEYMNNEVANKTGIPVQQINTSEFEYGTGTSGYRANEYKVAMMYAGYYI